MIMIILLKYLVFDYWEKVFLVKYKGNQEIEIIDVDPHLCKFLLFLLIKKSFLSQYCNQVLYIFRKDAMKSKNTILTIKKINF